MTKKKSVFIVLALIFIAIMLSYILIPEKSIRDFLYYVRGVPEGSCASDDTNCMAEKKMSGVEVSYAKHQCDGPKGCHSPDSKDIQAAIASIREYTNNPKLQIIPINGITPAGILYYCATDNHCWGVEAKTNKVVSDVGKLLQT